MPHRSSSAASDPCILTLAPELKLVREALLIQGPWTPYLVLHVDCGIDAWRHQARYEAACQALALSCERIVAALGVQDFEFQGTPFGLGAGEGFWEWLTFGTVAFQIGVPWRCDCPPQFVQTAIDVVEAEVQLALQSIDRHGHGPVDDHELFFVATGAAA